MAEPHYFVTNRDKLRTLCQVVEEDGSVLACALNATCMALMDSVVPMRCAFASICCAVVDISALEAAKTDGNDSTSGILVDPDQVEEADSSGLVTYTQAIGVRPDECEGER